MRIMVIGGPGSGKSTLARRLGDATGLPVFHMDQIHFFPGWVARPKAEKIRLANEVEAQEQWIFEGGLSATYENRAARADLVVFLDVPLGVRLWRVFRRIWRHYGQTRPDLPPGCPEQLDWSFIWWIISTARRNRARDLKLVLGVPAPNGVVVRNNRELDAFVARMTREALDSSALAQTVKLT